MIAQTSSVGKSNNPAAFCVAKLFLKYGSKYFKHNKFEKKIDSKYSTKHALFLDTRFQWKPNTIWFLSGEKKWKKSQNQENPN